MIRLSTKGRYGTRLLVNLAMKYADSSDAVILKTISEEEELSIRYLEQIIIPLKLNKLVKSVRGAGGGYTLYRHPSDIRLTEILRVLEGNCCLVDCVEDETACHRQPRCAAYDVWKGATEVLKAYFDSITLQDLAVAQQKKYRKVPARTKAD